MKVTPSPTSKAVGQADKPDSKWGFLNISAYSRPIAPLLLSLIFGIYFGNQNPHFEVAAFLILSAGIGFILFEIAKRKSAFLSPILIFFALGYLSILPWAKPHLPVNHISHFSDATRYQITGIIDDMPKQTGNRIRFILDVTRLKKISTNDIPSYPVTGKIRVTVMGYKETLFAGNRLTFVGKIKKIRNFNNPGGFDYKRYMIFRGIWGSAFVVPKQILDLQKGSTNRFKGTIISIRNNISDTIDRLHPISRPEETKAVLKALVVGMKNEIRPDLRNAFNRAGVSHILAISGLHVGIVATGAFFLFSWLLSRFRFFLWQALTRKGAAILSLLPVFAYGFIAGMSPSTQRAVIMVSVFLIAFMVEKEHDPINTLAVAALLILIFHPPSLFYISFQLSFVSVLSIIYGLGQTQHLWKNVKTKIPSEKFSTLRHRIRTFFLVSVFAVAGTLPLTMYYFNQVSVVGILANMLIIPIIGFIVVPLGLFAVLVYPISVYATLLFLNLSAAILSGALEVVFFFSHLPFAAFTTITPSLFEIGCFYILLWGGLKLIYYRREKTGPEKDASAPAILVGSPKYKRLRWLATRNNRVKFLVGLVILALVLDTVYWLNYRLWHKDLRVTIMDVKQGSASLLELPGGYNLLIDGGGFYDNSVFDMGEWVIAPFLWQKKITTVDTLILTHPNSDHLNGLLYIAKTFNVKQIWSNSEAAKSKGYGRLLEIVRASQIDMPPYNSLSRSQKINGIDIKILYPPSDFLQRKKKEKWRGYNNNSMVIKISYKNISFLFPGDIMSRAEKELSRRSGNALKSNFLVAPHHGSKTSSTQDFLDLVQPDIIGISLGWKTAYGFPHAIVLNRYRKMGSQLFRTDLHGALQVVTDGYSINIAPTIKEENR